MSVVDNLCEDVPPELVLLTGVVLFNLTAARPSSAMDPLLSMTKDPEAHAAIGRRAAQIAKGAFDELRKKAE